MPATKTLTSAPRAYTTDYEYIGTIPALGSLQLTEMARAFAQLPGGKLEDLFPDRTSIERTVRVERVLEDLQMAPVVQMGIPAGFFLKPERVESRVFEPVITREDDFVDQAIVNQLRQVGTYNEAVPAFKIVQDRIRRLVERQQRLKEYMHAQVLLGGINYIDHRTNYTVDVSTQIPVRNLFRYNGWDAILSSGSGLSTPMGPSTAYGDLTNNKNRREALFFMNTQREIGVPITNPNFDLVHLFRLIKQFLYNSNKNVFTEVVMSTDLYTVIQENELIKAYMGAVGTFIYDKSLDTVSSGRTPPVVSFGPGGDITAIAGLNIRVVDGLIEDPETQELKKLWPAHKIAIVAKNHFSSTSETLGYTYHCVGESPDTKPGTWMRTGPEQQPPSPPGMTVQIGNAFLPFAKYPQWIAIIDVCEPGDIEDKLILAPDLTEGVSL